MAIPPGVVTATFPEEPDATTAVMLVVDTTVNDAAAVPPKLTAVAPVKLVPVIVTVIPLMPLVGVKEVIVGARIKIKPGLVVVPTGVVTETFPEDPDATTAVMLVVDTTVNDAAAVPPKLTAVAPVKLVPVIVTIMPLVPLVGEKEVIVGGEIKIKPGLVPIPPGVVTATFPEDPNATTAMMLVAETTVNDAAAVPPKLTAVAPVKLVPVIVTVIPLTPLVGVKEVIVGAGIKIKPGLVAVPPGVVTETLPEDPDATTAVMLVADTTINETAAIPPKLTAVAPVKFVPVTVTVMPLPALVGVNEVIVGAGIKIKPGPVAVPPGVVTETFPDVPAATMAVMLVADTTVNDAAAVPPKLTTVAPVKFVPVIITVIPVGPLVGVKLVIVGGTMPRRTPKLLVVKFELAISTSASPLKSEIKK